MPTRNPILTGALLLALAALTGPAFAHGDAAGGRGGVRIESGDVVVEWLAANRLLCLSDHDSGAVLSTAQAEGRVIVAGAGAQPLTATDGNCLQYASPLAAGSKAVVSIRLPQRPPLQLRLEP